MRRRTEKRPDKNETDGRCPDSSLSELNGETQGCCVYSVHAQCHAEARRFIAGSLEHSPSLTKSACTNAAHYPVPVPPCSVVLSSRQSSPSPLRHSSCPGICTNGALGSLCWIVPPLCPEHNLPFKITRHTLPGCSAQCMCCPVPSPQCSFSSLPSTSAAQCRMHVLILTTHCHSSPKCLT